MNSSKLTKERSGITKCQVSYSLTKTDMERLIPFECPIYTYKELINYNSIDELIYPNGCCLLFFETEHKPGVINGHWTALMRRKISESAIKKNSPKTSIVYFNPYGTVPDDEKKMIDPEFQEMIGQMDNTLTKLLYLSNNSIEYNERRLQKFVKGNNTCGRHCLCFILSSNKFSLEEYQHFMTVRGTTPDQKVIILTQPVLENKMRPIVLQNKLNELISEALI